ncbi:MAG: Tat proofreading chaperone DmsD [Tropicimonas sp.]|uniref:Tat proofreading chaperone DmsD n=1 Tax=Tropicimonas sp. TaxID=2067044 RepID=UPI003A8B35C7
MNAQAGAPAEGAPFDAVAACLAVLGTLFRIPPDDPSAIPVLAFLRGSDLGADWPLGAPEPLGVIQRQIAQDRNPAGEEAATAWRRLFIGPGHFVAPPWGSVYLDKDNVLFGDSLWELRAFLERRGIALESGLNEPEDHIGLLLQLASDLAGRGDDAALRELLAEHLLPWSTRYLDLLATEGGHPFYTGLADLTALTLRALADRMDLRPAYRILHF